MDWNVTSSDFRIAEDWFFPKLIDYFDWETNAVVQNSKKTRKARSKRPECGVEID